MNPALTGLLPVARATGTASKLRVTILYECLDTGKHAKRLADQLADEEAANCALDLSLWSFGVLGLRQVRNDSVGTAAAADLVILSMSGRNPLPARVEKWVEMWIWFIGGHKPAVVALFAAPDAEVACIRAYLRRAAVSKGLKFFPHTICAVDDTNRESFSCKGSRAVDASAASRRPFSEDDAVMEGEHSL